MATEREKRRRRKEAQGVLENLAQQGGHVLLIHYSCESFYDRPEGKTPRVTSIAVRNHASGSTMSFSIHKIAEIKHVAFADIEQHYDTLEKEMLDEFFTYLGKHKDSIWVHWNMRDINYGFPALEHRYRVLGGAPDILPEANKVDLARLLVALYGTGYIGHPRLQKLIEKNKITDIGFLSGKEEADAFDNKEYVKLHQSTLRKIDTLSNILGRTADGSIKTNAKWREVHGINPQLWAEVVGQHWIVVLIVLVASIVTIGMAIGNVF